MVLLTNILKSFRFDNQVYDATDSNALCNHFLLWSGVACQSPEGTCSLLLYV